MEHKTKNRIINVKLFITVVISIIACALFVGCSDNGTCYTVEYIAGSGGYILGENSQKIASGNDGSEVVAVANDGYVFVKWSDGVKTAVRQDKAVGKSLSVSARFTKKSYNLSYDAQTGGYIIGEAAQSVLFRNDGTEVCAVPEMGYKFVKCCATGAVFAQYHAAGFVLMASKCVIRGCNTSCDINITNTDPDATARTLACGFVAGAGDSEINNCSARGRISGLVLTAPTVGDPSCAGDFAGVIRNTTVINCKVLVHDDTFATDSIVINRTPELVPDLTVYTDLQDIDE